MTAAGFGILRTMEACATAPVAAPLPVAFRELRDRYFIFHLQRNPVTSTYLGGDGYSPDLADTNARLRDFRQASLNEEIRFYRDVRAALLRVVPGSLSPVEQVDFRLMSAQVGFLIHQLAELQYFRRSLDTYVGEPFRGVDWQIQQMVELPGGMLGTEENWKLVVARTLQIPGYLEVAKTNLLAGKKAGSIPDKRMVERDGINGSKANADYFRNTFPKTAQPFLGPRDFAPAMLAQIGGAGIAAANAWEAFATFLSQTYDVNEAIDRFAVGEAEYEWRVHNVLGDPRGAAELYEYGAAQVALYTSKMVDVARAFAADAKMGLSFNTDAEKYVGIRRVMDFLSKDACRRMHRRTMTSCSSGTATRVHARLHSGANTISSMYRRLIASTSFQLRPCCEAPSMRRITRRRHSRKLELAASTLLQRATIRLRSSSTISLRSPIRPCMKDFPVTTGTSGT